MGNKSQRAGETAPLLTLQPRLPLQSTPFVGRKEELIALVTRLHDPACRLLTILGPGGIGKTRLALQAVSTLADRFTHGAYFIPLVGVETPAYVVPAMASALGFSFYGKADQRQQLLDFLRDKAALLVLDNVEQLLDGVDLFTDILQNAPEVKLLVTSRERLKLPDEWLLEIQGLAYPSENQTASASEWSAVQLFLHSAGRAFAGYVPTPDEHQAIVSLCQQVEGMPLAIELAAAWVRMLSPAEIAREMEADFRMLDTRGDQSAGRHRSISSTFERSWRLMSVEEQRVFRGLAVFRQGFRTEAAKQVTGCSLQTLASLVDQSLLRGSPSGRYEMHELLRQYAEERLHEVPEQHAAAESQHSAYYLDFLRQREPHLKGEGQLTALREIQEETDNLRVAWFRALHQGAYDRLDGTLDGLTFFYEFGSLFQEGDLLLKQTALQVPQEHPLHYRLLSRRAWLLITLGQYDEARGLLERSLEHAETHHLPTEIAFSQRTLSIITLYLGDVEGGEAWGRKALALNNPSSDKWNYARALYQLGFILNHHTNPDRKAIQTIEREAIDYFRELGDRFNLTKALTFLGWITYLTGEFEEAKDLLEESLSIAREFSHKLVIARTLDTLGMVTMWGLHDSEAARVCFEQGLALQREIGNLPGIGYSLNNLGDMAYQRADYAEARRIYSDYLVIARRMDEAQGLVLAIGGLADAANGLGEYQTALQNYQEALKLAVEKVPSLSMALVYGIGLMFKNMGDRDRAAALFALNAHYPGNPVHMKELSKNLLKELKPPADDLGNDRDAAVAFITPQVKALAKMLSISRTHLDLWLSELEGEPTAPPPAATPELLEALSERELDVLRLMGEGCSNPDIAERLVISKGTVKTHTLNIYRKLSVNSRMQAVVRAKELGLL